MAAVTLFAFGAPLHAEDKLDFAAPVPADDTIKVMGTLPSGMRYWIRPHQKPRGSVTLVLHVASGSVQEDKDQRGYAHFVEHMAFEGSKHFPPGTVVPYFASLGITFGLHQNAHTSFAHTEYSIQMPSYTEASFARAVLFLADVTQALSFVPEEVEKEIPVVLEEFRYRGGLEGRLWRATTPLLFHGSRYAFRQPIGDKDDVRAATAEKLRAYHETWYRPDRTTLVVVGDVEPAAVEKEIQKAFGAWKRPAKDPPDLRMGTLTPKGIRVGVHDDPDEHYTRVTLTHNRRVSQPETLGDVRHALLDHLAVRLMNARLEYLRRTKVALYAYAWMRQDKLVPGLELVELGASGREGSWIGCLREVVHEVERVHRHGFTQDELDRERASLLARYDSLPEQTSDQIATGYGRTLAGGMEPIAASTWERVTRASLPEITAADVTNAFRALFDLDDATIMLSVPEAQNQMLPTEPEVLEYYKEAREDKLATWAERNASLVVASVLEKDPEPGEVEKRTEDKALGIVSFHMKNGVRVNLRTLRTPGRVQVRVGFLGGRIEETEENLGITDLAFTSLSCDGIATRRVDPDTVTRYLMTRQMGFDFTFDQASIDYDVWAARSDLDDAMRLLYLLLTEPTVHYNAFKEARERTYSWRWSAQRDVADAADQARRWQMSGQDARWRAPDYEAYEKITEEAAQAWLARIVRTAPLEVAIVGDIGPEDGEALARRWFGSLPAREDRRKALRKLRRAKSWKGPVRREETVESSDPGAVVILAWRVAEGLDEATRSALDHAAYVIDARLHDELREQEGLSYDVAARFAESDVEGLDHLEVSLTTDPAKAAKAAEVARRIVQTLAKDGPSPTELETVGRQWSALLDLSKDRASRWLSRLTRLDLDDRAVEDVSRRLSAWRSPDGALLARTIRNVLQDANLVQVIALPKPAPKDGAGK